MITVILRLSALISLFLFPFVSVALCLCVSFVFVCFFVQENTTLKLPKFLTDLVHSCLVNIIFNNHSFIVFWIQIQITFSASVDKLCLFSNYARKWSSHDRIWFSGLDKQEIKITKNLPSES
jgi:hypothetical protein